MNLEARIEKLEKAATPSNEPIAVVWLPKECATTEEWLQHVDAWQNGQPFNIEWRAISSRGVEATHYGSSPPAKIAD